MYKRKYIILFMIAAMEMMALLGCGKNSDGKVNAEKEITKGVLRHENQEERESSDVESGSLEDRSVQQTSLEGNITQEVSTTEPVTTEKAFAAESVTTEQLVIEPVTTEIYIVDQYTEETYSQWQKDSTGLKTRIHYTNTYDVYSDGSYVLSVQKQGMEYDYSEIEIQTTPPSTVSGNSLLTGNVTADGDSAYSANLSYLQEVLALTNEVRAEVGAAPLVLDETLSRAACARAAEIAYHNFFSHTRPDGTDCFSVFGLYGITYNACGENIAAGQQSPQEVVEGWKNSPGHYANMISTNFTKLGVGYVKSESFSYETSWVQMFTN